MNLPRLHYTLPELAERWGWSEEEILHLAKAGKITLSFWWRGWAVQGKGNVADWFWIDDEPVSFDSHLVAGFLRLTGIKNSISESDGVVIHEVTMTDDNGAKVRLHAYHDDLHFSSEGFINSDGKAIPRKTIVPPFITRSEIVVLPDEVARFEAGESLKEQAPQRIDEDRLLNSKECIDKWAEWEKERKTYKKKKDWRTLKNYIKEYKKWDKLPREKGNSPVEIQESLLWEVFLWRHEK